MDKTKKKVDMTKQKTKYKNLINALQKLLK